MMISLVMTTGCEGRCNRNQKLSMYASSHRSSERFPVSNTTHSNLDFDLNSLAPCRMYCTATVLRFCLKGSASRESWSTTVTCNLGQSHSPQALDVALKREA